MTITTASEATLGHGIVLSNHGGRQLGRAPVPLYLLPRVATERGDATEICWAPAPCRGPTFNYISNSIPTGHNPIRESASPR